MYVLVFLEECILQFSVFPYPHWYGDKIECLKIPKSSHRLKFIVDNLLATLSNFNYMNSLGPTRLAPVFVSHYN